jgi:hypothetical protein
MRRHVMGGLLVLAVVLTASWAGAAGKQAATKAKPAVAVVKLRVNGTLSTARVIVVKGVPMLAADSVGEVFHVGSPAASVMADGEIALTRSEAIVRVKPGAKVMRVDGQEIALPAPATVQATRGYVPAQVLQALFPECRVAMGYQPRTSTVLLNYTLLKPAAAAAPAPEEAPATAPAAPVVAEAPAAPTTGGPAACAPSSGGSGVATQEFGKAGAKVEILSLLPITHGCHARTEAELKKAQAAHPSDIHLVIVDLFGSEAPKYLSKVGNQQRPVVSINGNTSFTLNGKRVVFEYQEDRLYAPSDLAPAIEQALKAS